MLFLTSEEVNHLAEATPAPYETLVYVLAYGGLRWGEAAALRRRRIDIVHSRIEIAESLAEVGGDLHFGSTKNYKTRTITVPGFLRDRLNHHLTTEVASSRDALVFTARNGAAMRNTNFARNIWKPSVQRVGLPATLRIHDLRHTAAALMILHGAHPEVIKRHLGHSSIVVTMDTYGHLFPSEAEALADRLDGMYRNSQTDRKRTGPPVVAAFSRT